MTTKKQTRGCNLCAATAKAARQGKLKEPHDCLVCVASYKRSKERKLKGGV